VGWKYEVTPEQFVVAWQTSATVAEVAGRVGMPEATASARATDYRRKGINLKRMRRGRKGRLDVEGLKALAESLKPNKEVRGC
jgi:transposase